MTITDLNTAPPDYRAATDDDLAVIASGADEETYAAIVAELTRRDRADRMAKARKRLGDIRGEGKSAAFAQYLEADAVCRGTLLSRDGIAAGISDEQVLWTLPEEQAQRFASEELRDFWLYVAPRITPAGYVRECAAERRAEHAAVRDAARISKGDSTDEHDNGTAGPGLADADPGSLRHEATAPEAPQAGTRGPVQRGGRGTAGEDTTGDRPRAGRPGGTVRPAIAGEKREDMGIVYDTYRIGQAANRSAQESAAARQEASDIELAHEAAYRLDAEIYGPGAIVPGEQDSPENTPGDLKFILDETAAFVAKHVAATQAQTDAMTLYAAATYALHAFPTFGRMLFTSEQEASGKTVAMMITAALSANPLDASGTSYALQSALAAASNAPEQLTPTLYYDEISNVFGRSGLAASRDPIGEILRKGYKSGATRAWSVNRTSEPYSVYTPFLMAGLRNAVPRDIRSRCIPLVLRPGTPEAYFDAREAEPEATALAACLAQAVSSRITAIAAFRGRGIHPRLRDRQLEVWEALFAVAYILGGQEWLNRCLAAFRELSLAEADAVVLTPRQQTVRDVAEVTAACEQKTALEDGTEFAGGLVIVDELRRLDNPRYRGRSEAGLALLVSDALPMNTVQVRIDGERVRGYYAADIAAAWEAVRPAEPEDAAIPEEVNPFEVAGDDVDEIAGQHDVTADSGKRVDTH